TTYPVTYVMIATLTLEALKSNFLFSSEFNFHVKDIGDAHEKSSIFKDDGYKVNSAYVND
ncbi:TPA: hypothetical protein ACITOM_004496, partial [Salmonella enterica subsp. enterica serovar Mississippi]